MQPSPSTPFARAIAVWDVPAAIRAARKDPTVLKLRLPTGYGYERPLHAAVRLKSTALARVLLDQGMNVDIPDSRGFTPLALAPESYARLSMVELLVARGADIHFRNDWILWSAIWQAAPPPCLPRLTRLNPLCGIRLLRGSALECS